MTVEIVRKTSGHHGTYSDGYYADDGETKEECEARVLARANKIDDDVKEKRRFDLASALYVKKHVSDSFFADAMDKLPADCIALADKFLEAYYEKTPLAK